MLKPVQKLLLAMCFCLLDGMSQYNKKYTDASGDIDLGISGFILIFHFCHHQGFSLIYFLIAAKLSLLISCSILQASSTAIFSSTPRRISHAEIT